VGKYTVDRDPANPESHYYLGFSYLWARQLDEAIASFRTALAADTREYRCFSGAVGSYRI
jgi:cytochrome c-type biogenesis protein CcmH/NrfG